MTRERRLGRGLEALLSRTVPADEVEADTPDEQVGSITASQADSTGQPPQTIQFTQIRNAAETDEIAPPASANPSVNPSIPATGPTTLPIDQIHSNPSQPRQEFDAEEIRSLSENLQSHGQLQPVVVRRKDDHWELIAGERRLRAAMEAGWSEVNVQIVEADDRESAEIALIENVHRKDLGAIEKAVSFQRYLEQYGCKQEDLAGRLNLNRSTIANFIRLLELPGTVQEAVRLGQISQGHARALLPLGEHDEQIAFCQRIQQEGLNVRQTEQIVREIIHEADEEPMDIAGELTARAPRRPPNPHVAELEQEFRSALGMKVKLTHGSRGRGKLTIHFTSHEDFDRLQEHICAPPAYPTRRAG